MSFNIPLHILSDHKSCKETSGNCHNEQEGIFTAEISQNSKQHRNDKEHQPGAHLQSIDYCLNFSSVVESWEWNIRDRDIQELAQRSPALLHIPNQQLLPGNMLYHILHMILPELNTTFFPCVDSGIGALLQGHFTDDICASFLSSKRKKPRIWPQVFNVVESAYGISYTDVPRHRISYCQQNFSFWKNFHKFFVEKDYWFLQACFVIFHSFLPVFLGGFSPKSFLPMLMMVISLCYQGPCMVAVTA